MTSACALKTPVDLLKISCTASKFCWFKRRDNLVIINHIFSIFSYRKATIHHFKKWKGNVFNYSDIIISEKSATHSNAISIFLYYIILQSVCSIGLFIKNPNT